ncbi:MAG: conjugal transfer protein TraH [Colwellia sp.]
MNKLKISLLVISLGLTNAAHADNVMKDIFNGMKNSNSASMVNTATRNGVTLGSFGYRIPQQKQPVASLALPSTRAGCGGIDFFAGSFSVINSDQLVQMFRSIAQGAASYSFELALNSVCPSCAGIMSKLEAKLAELNQFASEGCKASQAAARFATGGLRTALKDNWLNNAVSDLDNHFFSDQGDKLASANDTGNASKKAEQLGIKIDGNITWQLLLKSGVKDWDSTITNFQGYKLLELIMSLTGYSQITKNGDNSNDSSGLSDSSGIATLTVSELLNGTNQPIKLYECIDYDQCISPTLKLVPGWKSLQEQYATLLGSGLTKSRTNSATPFTHDELAAFAAIGMRPHVALSTYKGSSIESIANLLSYRAVRSIFLSLKQNINEKMIPSIKGSKNKLSDIEQVSVKDTLDSLNQLDKAVTEALEDFDKKIISRAYSLEVMINLSKLSQSMS